MREANRKGGAALVAVLVMIIIISVGCALMVVTGRSSIAVNDKIDAPMPSGYDAEPTPQETIENTDDSVDEELLLPRNDKLPAVSPDYQTISLDDATFNSAILMDATTNEIIAGYKYDKKIYPASLTKLLTLLVAAEHIDDLHAKYKFEDEDIDRLIEENASLAGFVGGETVTMEDLLYASILVSGADGTVGLANAVAGSEAGFVKMMNEKLEELGLEDTKFVNSSGLHDKQHYSTAQDLAVITKACLENPVCRKVISTEEYTTSETEEHVDGITLNSIFHSRYGGFFIDTDGDGEEDAPLLGGKTGFTDEAMYTLSSVVTYNGHDYICVVTKCMSDDVATSDTIMVFENYLPGAVGTTSDSSEEDEDEDEDEDSDEEEDEEEEDDEEEEEEDGDESKPENFASPVEEN